MPGDPKECRQHALNCVQLAKKELPEARDRFAHSARTWIRLAEELERIQAVLAEEEDEEELEAADQPFAVAIRQSVGAWRGYNCGVVCEAN